MKKEKEIELETEEEIELDSEVETEEETELDNEMEKKNKKPNIVTIVLLALSIALVIYFVYGGLRSFGILGSTESEKIIKEFNENYNSEERKIIYYQSSECSYCEMENPIIETIAEDYDLEYCSIDSSLLSLSQRKEVLEKLDIEHATPTTVIVEGGKIIDTQVGYVDGNTFVEFLKENDILSEDAIYSAEKNITYIDYDKYESLIADQKTNIIVIGQTSCSHCISFKPALNSVGGDYDLTINYLNLTELSEDESENFFESLEKIQYNEPDFLEDGSLGTPLTLIVTNGKVTGYISGERTISQLVREFTKLGLIEG